MFKPILYILTASLALSVPAMADAQAKKSPSVSTSIDKIKSNTISGTVLDENEEPLPGATVMIEGTGEGTSTDMDGNFTLLCHKPEPTLVFSYVGMKTKQVRVDKNYNYIRIVMEAVPNMMEEVVVTGYQNIKRENATGSYQIIRAEDMDKRYTGDITSNLEGRVPGVVFDPKSNTKDENAITIRGKSTFNAKESPLVVVDGLPIEGGMNTVNPYDIENITILKDAAAASIYGARASNGVIVITSKKAKSQKLSIDFNADLQISEKMNYDNYNWASAADLIQLEKYNFDAMLKNNPQSIQDNFNLLDRGKANELSQVMRVLLENNRGNISDEEMNSTFSRWSRNNYSKEYQKVHDRTQISQQYNLALRVSGKTLSSNIVVNWNGNNGGVRGYDASSLALKYLGDLKVASWMDLNLSLNVLNNRTKSHALGSYGNINSFLAYQSMYNPDGSLARMEADIYPGEEVLNNPEYELKDVTYNVADEIDKGYNTSKSRYTNVRTNVLALFRLPVTGWTAQAQFQYEDIVSISSTQYSKDSQFMRSLYNRYTTSSSVTEWVDTDDPFNWDFGSWDGDPDHFYKDPVTINKTIHNIPDGDALSESTAQSQYYTFRAQTRYNREFLGVHAIDFIAGFEYRQTHSSMEQGGYYGYDRQTSSNLNMITNWEYINKPTVGVMGSNYTPYGAPISFRTSETLHRYYSYYFTGNYVYDSRYSVSGSYRVDKADMFGTDPKFRGKPLWSVGASWNVHNERFLRPATWLNVLKLRASYGLTGNIDNSVSSYLTASMATNQFGNLQGTLNTPPNDQLRWEKTATWNAGIDFAFLGYRLAGTFDFYRKNSSDILTSAELDPTTGWTTQTINSAKMTNTGVELQLDGQILPARRRKDIGINLGFNIAYNHNKVTDLRRYPTSASEFLGMTYHKGYPLNSLFSIDYAGLVDKDGTIFVGWYDRNGEVQTTSTSSSTFTMDDVIFSGTTTPKISGSLTPEIRWNGFSLSAMFAFYGGHYMRTDNDAWTSFTAGTAGYKGAFGDASFSRDLLRYWNGDEVPANGWMSTKNGSNISTGTIRNTAVKHADYMKFRSLILSYSFDQKLCRKIGLNDLRLRFQMNNIATWARNGIGIDPEAYNLTSGFHMDKTPRSYTMSLMFNL